MHYRQLVNKSEESIIGLKIIYEVAFNLTSVSTLQTHENINQILQKNYFVCIACIKCLSQCCTRRKNILHKHFQNKHLPIKALKQPITQPKILAKNSNNLFLVTSFRGLYGTRRDIMVQHVKVCALINTHGLSDSKNGQFMLSLIGIYKKCF